MSSSLQKVASTIMSPKKVSSILSNKDIMNMGLLFFLLSPGLLLQVPSNDKEKFSVEFMNMKTSQSSVLMHALVLLIVSYFMYSGLQKDKLVLAILLFVLLSPGFLLELPPSEEGWLNTNKTSVPAIFVHTLVFMLLYGTLR